MTAVVTWLRQTARDTCLRSDSDVGGNPHVARDAGLASNGNTVANGCAAGNAGLTTDDHAIPNFYVVSNLHKVIEVAPLTDHCVAYCASINACLGADGTLVSHDDPAQVR